jgi:hypothetical protein
VGDRGLRLGDGDGRRESAWARKAERRPRQSGSGAPGKGWRLRLGWRRATLHAWARRRERSDGQAPQGGSVAASRQPEALNGVERSGGSGMAARPGGAGYGFARCGRAVAWSRLEDVGDDGAFGLVVHDDGLTGGADGLEDHGQVSGVGRGETGDHLDVVEEGEAMDDQHVGLGDDVGGKRGRALGGQGQGETEVAALLRPAGERQGRQGARGGEVVGLVDDQPVWVLDVGYGRSSGGRRVGEQAGDEEGDGEVAQAGGTRVETGEVHQVQAGREDAGEVAVAGGVEDGPFRRCLETVDDGVLGGLPGPVVALDEVDEVGDGVRRGRRRTGGGGEGVEGGGLAASAFAGGEDGAGAREVEGDGGVGAGVGGDADGLNGGNRGATGRSRIGHRVLLLRALFHGSISPDGDGGPLGAATGPSVELGGR